MTDLLGSSGMILIASAAIFGPLAGWLAGRRDRQPVVWLVFGALLGPIALLILAVSPPGRCQLCDSPVRGWTADCLVCGGPLAAPLGAAIRPASVEPSGVAVDAVQPLAGRRPEVSPIGGPASPAVPVSARAGRSPQVGGTVASTWTRPAPISAEASAPSDPAHPDGEEVLATGICFGGTSRLIAGARYLITRDDAVLRLLGPVDLDPSAVALERPLAHLTASAVGERLVITEGPGDRVRLALALGSFAGATASQLEAALSDAPADYRTGHG